MSYEDELNETAGDESAKSLSSELSGSGLARSKIKKGNLIFTFKEESEAQSMSTASPKVQDLARRLLAFEAGQQNSTQARVDVAVQVIEELRLRLVKLAGVVGFRSLLSRALTLAKSEVPSLKMVQVSVDGSLEGFDGIEKSQEPEAAVQAGTVLVAHLLDLLVIFIGQPLTLRLIRDKWPDASIDEVDLRTGENHERA